MFRINFSNCPHLFIIVSLRCHCPKKYTIHVVNTQASAVMHFVYIYILFSNLYRSCIALKKGRRTLWYLYRIFPSSVLPFLFCCCKKIMKHQKHSLHSLTLSHKLCFNIKHRCITYKYIYLLTKKKKEIIYLILFRSLVVLNIKT